ncbi:MAG: GTP-binding protein [Bacteroidales bacterium]|jgi:G3E family GTPase|nr:GTP-binding protein [Bacteroidales bacterium]
MKQTIPVLLLTGYLGSGKTTLVNKILTNKRGIKFAVIVNDIGEVNIDASLIQQGGIVGQNDDSLVALQNGCICCTLKMDLIQQLTDITNQGRFDYIVIEASGICEPGPIAQTIYSIPQVVPEKVSDAGIPELDCIVTVVDALRLKDEFGCGHDLMKQNLGEEDLENLVIQQIEFCNIILLNKASEVSKEELGRIRRIIETIQPVAKIIECDYCDVDLDQLVSTHMFDFDKVATSAKWIQEVEGGNASADDDDDDDDEHECHHHHDHDDDDDDHEHECHHHHHDHDDEDDNEGHHCHHHHHHHHDDEGEAEEYGIGTFVYMRREPFNLGRFDEFVARHWPKSVIRCKGMCYFGDERDTCYVFEQAGRQVNLRNAGRWYATMPKAELEAQLAVDQQLQRDWDETYGDRMQKLVFIGQHMDKKAIFQLLDECLEVY